jgi:hypothetical protein
MEQYGVFGHPKDMMGQALTTRKQGMTQAAATVQATSCPECHSFWCREKVTIEPCSSRFREPVSVRRLAVG